MEQTSKQRSTNNCPLYANRDKNARIPVAY